MSDEWGPWIDHNGSGCPCVGMWVQAKAVAPSGKKILAEGMAGSNGGDSWDWSKFGNVFGKALVAKITEYRIRKPRGMAVLEALVADVPAPKVPA